MENNGIQKKSYLKQGTELGLGLHFGPVSLLCAYLKAQSK
jgi:hypothetical protein